MIYRLSMFEKLQNIMRYTVCRRFLHHIVLSYYIWDNVCRTFMRHIVVSYYIKATDVKKNGNPFCSKLLHFDCRCQCSCKAKCTFCNVTTFWVATERREEKRERQFYYRFAMLLTISLYRRTCNPRLKREVDADIET